MVGRGCTVAYLLSSDPSFLVPPCWLGLYVWETILIVVVCSGLESVVVMGLRKDICCVLLKKGDKRGTRGAFYAVPSMTDRGVIRDDLMRPQVLLWRSS